MSALRISGQFARGHYRVMKSRKDDIVRYTIQSSDGRLCPCQSCGGWQPMWEGETVGGDLLRCCGTCGSEITRVAIALSKVTPARSEPVVKPSQPVSLDDVAKEDDEDTRRLRVLASQIANEAQLHMALSSIKNRFLRAHVKALIVPMLSFKVEAHRGA